MLFSLGAKRSSTRGWVAIRSTCCRSASLICTASVAVALDIVALLACAYASALIIQSGVGARIMDLLAISMMCLWGHDRGDAPPGSV